MLRWMTRLLGPVFAKEMVEMARRKRYYLNRVLFGLGLLCALGMAWENSRWQFGYDRTPLLQDLANLAHTMFVAVATVQYIAVFVFVPPLLCGVVASEREAHTLDLLLTTQMSDREIVLGKLGSRLWVVLLLMLSGLPVMNIIMLFGGVDPASVWRVQAATLLAMLYAGAHSIYFSSATRSPLGALVRTYWWMALWLMALPMMIVMIAELFRIRPGGPGSIIVYGLVLMNPIFSFASAIERYTYQEFARHIGNWFFPGTFIVPGAWALFLMWRAVVRLRWTPKQYSPFAAITRWFRERRSEAQRRRSERSEARGAQVWTGADNPLWRRARLSHAYDRDGHLRKIQWAGWALAFLFFWLLVIIEPRAFRAHGEGPAVFLSVTWIVVALLTAIVSANSLVGDRWRGFFDMVLTTPMEPREIIDGTLLAVWQHVRLGFFLAWVMLVLFVLIGSASIWNSVLSVTTAMLFGLVIAMLGVLCSLVAKNVTAALVPTIAIPLLLCIGPPLLVETFRQDVMPFIRGATVVALGASLVLVRWKFNVWTAATWFMAMHFAFAGLGQLWSDGGHVNAAPVLGMNPAALTIMTLADELEREVRRNYLYDGGHVTYQNAGLAWHVKLTSKATMIVVSEWLALAATFLWARWWTIRHFDRLVGRRDWRVTAGNPSGLSSAG